MNQISLFDTVSEKGSREWGLAAAVHEDKQPGMFRVLSPRKPETPRYANVVRIRRYHTPTRLFPRGA